MKRINSRERRGNAIIEFALLWAVLFPLVAGAAQFGSAFYQYNNLCSTVRNAARYLSIQTYESSNETIPDTLLAEVRNVVRYGSPAPANGATLIVNVPPQNINVTMTFSNNAPASVKVTIARFDIDMVVKTFTINNKPESQFPFVGRWDPVD